VVKTLADEHGPSGVRINGLMPVRIATDRVRQLDALAGDPDKIRARRYSASRDQDEGPACFAGVLRLSRT
jgi:NAD(P)-dependent dehydrogenase (short-subunit alcohol dehydrogenase family)